MSQVTTMQLSVDASHRARTVHTPSVHAYMRCRARIYEGQK